MSHEHLMVLCRFYTYAGMGWISQPVQARLVYRCAAARLLHLLHLLTNRKSDPKEDP